MKFIPTSSKSTMIILMIALCHLICIINATKMSAIKESAKFENSRRKKSKSTSSLKKRSHTKSKSRGMKASRVLRKRKTLGTSKVATKFRIRLIVKIYNLFRSFMIKGKGILVAIAKIGSSMLSPFVYLVKWVWEKTKSILAKFTTINTAIQGVSDWLNSPITKSVNAIFERFSKTDAGEKTEEEVNAVLATPERLTSEADIPAEYKETMKEWKSLEAVGELNDPTSTTTETPPSANLITNITDQFKIDTSKEALAASSDEFYGAIMDNFTMGILNEMNPFGAATANLDEKMKAEQTEASDLNTEDNRTKITEGINNIYTLAVNDAMEICKLSPEYNGARALLTKATIETINHYKEYFNKLIETMNKKPAEISKVEYTFGEKDSEDQEKKSYAVFSSMKVFASDMVSIFSTLFLGMGKAFKKCMKKVAESFVDKFSQNVKTFLSGIGEVLESYALSFLDSLVNTIPIWSQIRGIFDTFLSIWSIVSEPFKSLEEIVASIQEQVDGVTEATKIPTPTEIGTNIGTRFALFTINAVKAGLAFLNLQGMENMFKHFFGAYLIIMGKIKRVVDVEFGNEIKTDFQIALKRGLLKKLKSSNNLIGVHNTLEDDDSIIEDEPTSKHLTVYSKFSKMVSKAQILIKNPENVDEDPELLITNTPQDSTDSSETLVNPITKTIAMSDLTTFKRTMAMKFSKFELVKPQLSEEEDDKQNNSSEWEEDIPDECKSMDKCRKKVNNYAFKVQTMTKLNFRHINFSIPEAVTEHDNAQQTFKKILKSTVEFKELLIEKIKILS